MNDEVLYQVALNQIPGIGPAAVKNLVSYSGSVKNIFASKKGLLKKIPGIGEKLAGDILQHTDLTRAERIIENCLKLNIQITHFTEKTFPQKLRLIYDSPSLLFHQGELQPLERKSVAIVGTRKATSYGKEITSKIIREMAVLNPSIISGLAYGIDIQAHRESLINGLPTYAVLAGGIDKIYPQAHKKTAMDMINTGGIISEHPPGTKSEAHLFPARNRIIAGLADTTIVVEAADKGGALITANIANSYNRLVFAVPGNLTSTYSKGTNSLINQQKALIYTGIEDLKYHLNWEEAKSAGRDFSSVDVGPEERAILKVLVENHEGLAVDDISWKTQIPIYQLASFLLSLEFSGLIKMLPGKKYTVTF